MTRKLQQKADPIECAMELAIDPGRFIPDRACFSFVGSLDEVSARIDQVTQSDPARAIGLYETFLAVCHQKAEEVDDSSGSFGQFAAGLLCGWIKARQCAGADPGATASRLLAWMDNDEYGFCYGLEKDAAKTFDKAGLAAFEKQIRMRFDAVTATRHPPGGSAQRGSEYERRRWSEMLRTLYVAKKNVQAYVALAEETELTAQDTHAIATMLVARRKPEDALAWVERGIEIDDKTPHGSMAGYDLAMLKRAILAKLGRNDEALEAAWAEYRKRPGKYAYGDLMMFVSKSERSVWHEKAMDAATSAELNEAMELFLETTELARLAELVGNSSDHALQGVSHYTSEPAAMKLEKTRPELAARLWRAQGMRIVNAKKSKYYDAALENFKRAKEYFEKAGLPVEWEKTVKQVRGEHSRKKGFMSGFENIVAGSGSNNDPSYLERAKARWGGHSST
jgi:tetratricopeptide (TPR) repeat protein